MRDASPMSAVAAGVVVERDNAHLTALLGGVVCARSVLAFAAHKKAKNRLQHDDHRRATGVLQQRAGLCNFHSHCGVPLRGW